MIYLKPGAAGAIKSFLAQHGIEDHVLRIDIRSTGCCDPSLALVADKIGQSDLVQKIEGITLVIRDEIYRQVGTVTISHTNEPGNRGFVLTAEKPLSEWEGFGVTNIQIPET